MPVQLGVERKILATVCQYKVRRRTPQTASAIPRAPPTTRANALGQKLPEPAGAASAPIVNRVSLHSASSFRFRRATLREVWRAPAALKTAGFEWIYLAV